jgi:MFS family permease
MNVAIVFIIALLTSFFAPMITRQNALEYGKFPMLVFGTLLLAIMPLSFVYKPNLLSISLGTMLGIIGGVICGVAQGLLTLDILKEHEREAYVKASQIMTIMPYFIAIPIAAYVAQVFGLKILFLWLVIALAAIVMPMYFFVVVANHNKMKI